MALCQGSEHERKRQLLVELAALRWSQRQRASEVDFRAESSFPHYARSLLNLSTTSRVVLMMPTQPGESE